MTSATYNVYYFDHDDKMVYAKITALPEESAIPAALRFFTDPDIKKVAIKTSLTREIKEIKREDVLPN